MAKKKDFLGDFEFKKLDNLSNGLEIPTTNQLKQRETPVEGKKTVKEPQQSVETLTTPKTHLKRHRIDLPNLDYNNKGEVKSMVNVVPTSSNVVPTSKKEAKELPTNRKSQAVKPQRQSITNYGFDKDEFGALTTKDDKVLYLAMRGWSLKIEKRRNALFHYATKYINRKKVRIYLGSVLN